MVDHIHGDWTSDFTKVVEQCIGQGTFGKVFLVRSLKSPQKFYAMKQISLTQRILKSSKLNREYALDEGLKLSRLNIDHSNIVKYYSSYLNNEMEQLTWIMEYCDGATLKERIALYYRKERHMEENLIWYWSLHILKGLGYLHSLGIYNWE
jgi:serine/threonine protein kinase